MDCVRKNLFQQVRHALGGLDGGKHEQIAVHIGEIQLIPGGSDQLGQEHPLGSAVALLEGVKLIGGAVEVVNSSTSGSASIPRR